MELSLKFITRSKLLAALLLLPLLALSLAQPLAHAQGTFDGKNIKNGTVPVAKIESQPAQRLLGNCTAGPSAVTACTAAEAKSALGITAGDVSGFGTMASQNASGVAITGGSITGITDLPISDGGTGSSTAADARTALGLGSMATQDSGAVTITGGSITGITDLPVADGGTGASTAANARTNLGLGSMATQSANSVAITGGSISGITDISIADGGTGASTAAGARTALGLGTIATQDASNVTITGGTVSGATVTPTGGSTASTLAAHTGRSLDVLDFGAVCNFTEYGGGSATASSTTYSTGATTLTAGTGRIILFGAGANGTTLSTTYTSVGTNSITLGAATSLTVGGGHNNMIGSTAVAAGTGYVPGDTITLTVASSTSNSVLTVRKTKVAATPTINAGGSGGTNGAVTVVGTTGTGAKFFASGTISGGALTAISAITVAGQYTTNPTSLSAEPILAYTGGAGFYKNSGLTGATVGLVMGVLTAEVTSPGAYTSALSNPYSQASTSGAGSGATFTMAQLNSSRFSVATDDTTAIQAAITYAGTVGAEVTLPSTYCGITSTLTNTANYVVIGSKVNGAEEALSNITRLANGGGLAWMGSAGGTMLEFTAVAGGGNSHQVGSGVHGLSFLSNRLAGIGLKIASVNSGVWENLYFEEFSTAGLYMTTVNGALGNPTTPQHNIINNVVGIQKSKLGNIIRLGESPDGGTTTGNVSYDTFTNISGTYANGNAIECIDADNVLFLNAHFFRVVGAVGAGLDAYGTDSVFNCRDNRFIQFGSGLGGMYFRGTETFSSQTTQNEVLGPDATNSDPLPVLGIGAQVSVKRSNGRSYYQYSVNPVFADADSSVAAALTAQKDFGFASAGLFYSTILLANSTTRCRFSIDANNFLQFSPNANCSGLNINSLGQLASARRITSGSSDSMGDGDLNIIWNSASGIAKTQTLKACSSATKGRLAMVADAQNDAASNNITITVDSSGTINGASSYVINTNRGAVNAVCDGNGNYVVTSNR